MIDEEKVILMTKLTSYEETEGKKNAKVGGYFRSDYLTIQLLKAFFSGTITFLICFALYILCDFEVFMQDIYKMDLVSFAQNILLYYVIFMVLYGVICYIAGTLRYIKAKKNMRSFYQNLKKLYRMHRK